jgi:hypothetical protein
MFSRSRSRISTAPRTSSFRHCEGRCGRAFRRAEEGVRRALPRRAGTCNGSTRSSARSGFHRRRIARDGRADCEGDEVIAESGDPVAKDAALIAAAQRIEHYEIAAYGTARTLADELDLDGAADLLDQTLDEEANATSS